MEWAAACARSCGSDNLNGTRHKNEGCDTLMTLAPGELARIEGGLPDLLEWSETACVEFQAKKLRNCQVLWLNDRWFLERGLDVEESGVRARLVAWLTNTFGYVVATSDPDDQIDLENGTTLFADRYGSNNGLFAHGGSGRAAIFGKFNVKGIGPTPLVGAGVNREHSHGSASVNVAIREAIFAEVVAAEFPHGGIPILAVLDTGLWFESSSTPGKMLRRSLIVRPSMVRPAHMQRAPAFIRPVDGHKNSQIQDAKRVREFIGQYATLAASLHGSLGQAITRFFIRIAEQIAFGHVHRIYSGGYFSSNLSIEAELLDFGNSYALPNWENAKVLENDLGFGRDLEVIKSTIRSLCFYFNKYRPGALEGNSEELIFASTHNAWKVALSEEFLRVWGLDGRKHSRSSQIIVNTMVSYFDLQQKSSVNYTRGEVSQAGWIWPAIGTGADRKDQAAVADTVQHTLRQEFRGSANSALQLDLSMLTAERFLQPRTSLMRDVLQQKIGTLLAAIDWSDADAGHRKIHELIRSSTDESRRHWRRLPKDIVVLGHCCKGGSSILQCVHRFTEGKFYWFDGPVVGSHLRLFSRNLELTPERMDEVIYTDTYWSLLVEVVDFKEHDLRNVGVEITVPTMTMNYGSWAR